MTNTWEVATIVAVLAGVVGFFVVARGDAFPAHAIPNGAFAGAAAASLYGFSSLLGLAVAAVLSALGIGALGRRGPRDAVTALTLVMMLALGALFLSQSGQYEQHVYSLLFGEQLGVSSTEVLPVAILATLSMAGILALWRPLLLNSIAPEIGEAKGVAGHRIEMLFLVVVALATALTVPVVGALLIFSLMIGAPAAARSFTDRPGRAVLLSVGVALAIVWLSIAMAYRTDWPIGFFIGGFGAVSYGIGRGWALVRR